MNRARLSGELSRSTYLRRILSSGSLRPWYFSGGGAIAFASRVNAVTRSEGSPRRVTVGTPSAPTMSPGSRSAIHRRNGSSPRSSTRANSWRSPEASERSRKALFPWARTDTRRPAIRNLAPSADVPGASGRHASTTCWDGTRPGYDQGYGSTPAARRRAAFSRRSRSRRVSSSEATDPQGAPGGKSLRVGRSRRGRRASPSREAARRGHPGSFAGEIGTVRGPRGGYPHVARAAGSRNATPRANHSTPASR